MKRYKRTLWIMLGVIAGLIVGGGIWTLAIFDPRVPDPSDKWSTPFSLDQGIKLLETLDSSGPPAFDPKPGDIYFYTSRGPGYGGLLSGVTKPGVAVFNANDPAKDPNAYQSVAWQEYSLPGVEEYFEVHALGVSPDVEWVYIPTARGGAFTGKPDNGRLLVVDARTLKLHQVLQTRGRPHHVKAFHDATGKPLVLAYDFNWMTAASAGAPLRGGSGLYVLDPKNNNRIVGGIDGRGLQGMPYVNFPSPDGKEIWVGIIPPVPRTIGHDLEGWVGVIDTDSYELRQAIGVGKYPVWTSFSADGKFAWVNCAVDNKVYKIDRKTYEVVAKGSAGGGGSYGTTLTWDEKRLWLINKGEGSHNRGTSVSVIDPNIMRPLAEIPTDCIRGDHITLHPDPDRKELWLSCNSSFEVVVVDYEKMKVKTRMPIPGGGSTHSGAFVRFFQNEKGEVVGEMVSDQAGLHGSAMALKKQMLRVALGEELIELKMNKTSFAAGDPLVVDIEMKPSAVTEPDLVALLPQAKVFLQLKELKKGGATTDINVAIPLTKGTVNVIGPNSLLGNVFIPSGMDGAFALVAGITVPGVTEGVPTEVFVIGRNEVSFTVTSGAAVGNVARGELIFKTAGGVGCIACHGPEGRGGTGIAPPNIGASAEKIRDRLATVPAMSFLSLTEQEILDVAAYLQSLPR